MCQCIRSSSDYNYSSLTCDVTGYAAGCVIVSGNFNPFFCEQDMQKWMESHGYFTAELDENTLKRLQMTYMQNWTASQRQAYMQWYWQTKQFPEPQGYQQMGIGGQRPNPSNIPV